MFDNFEYLKELSEKAIENDRVREAWIESCSDGVWDWDVDTGYEYMSPRFWEIFGYEASEKKHHVSEWQDLIHPDDLRTALDMLEAHFESKGKVPYKLKARYRHKQGHWVTVICRGHVVVWNKDGSPKRMIGTHTDIT